MKKFLLAVACVCTLALASCSGKSPEQQAVQLIEKTTARLEKVKSAEDIQKIGQEFQNDLMKLLDKYPDLKETGEDDPAIEKAINHLKDAVDAAEDKFGDTW